jgi:hypothetical protein
VHHFITNPLPKVIDAQGENCVGLKTFGEDRAKDIPGTDPKRALRLSCRKDDLYMVSLDQR